jgi:hypothetical protein
MQMQGGRSMGMGQYGHIGGMVAPTGPGGQYNPSPIARPQVSESQSWGRGGYEQSPPLLGAQAAAGAPPGGKHQYFSPEAGTEGSEEPLATEKAETEQDAPAEATALESGAGASEAAVSEEAPAQA